VQAGDIDRAYLLTNRGPAVGSTLAAFANRIREQLGVTTFPLDRTIDVIGRHGIQSCGNRLRRWVLGRKIDPDELSVDYWFDGPFEVRLGSDSNEQWRVIFFQSHAM
jgi:hypothetical protein